MDSFIKKKFNNIEFPSESIINCTINFENLCFDPLTNKVPQYIYDKGVSFWEIIVPTVETVKYEFILGMLLEKQRNVYLTGNSGTGKSSLAVKCLSLFSQKKSLDSFKIHFSTRTSSNSVQDSLLSNLFFLSQRSRGAAFGKKNIVFIDDIGMPQKDQFGA